MQPSAGGQSSAPLNLDAAKGVLISLIVLGHSRHIHFEVGAIYGFLYLWHVQCFFLLLAFRSTPLTFARLVDLFIRYMVPFALFVGALALVKGLLTASLPEVSERIGWALFFGSSKYVELATDAAVYWFLPSFFCVAVMLGALQALPKRGSLAVAGVVVALGIARGSFNVPLGTAEWPLGSGLAFYLAAQILLFRALWEGLGRSKVFRASWLFASLVALGLVAAFWSEVPPIVNVAIFRFPADPRVATAAMAIPMMALPVVLIVASWQGWARVWSYLGRRSMVIFLVHQPILFALWLAWEKTEHLVGSSSPALLAGFVTASAALGGSVLVANLLNRSWRLKALILPAGLSELRSGFGSRATLGQGTDQPSDQS